MTAPADRVAIYDLDRTVLRKPTFTLFLLWAAWREAPWRLLLLPALAALMIGMAIGSGVGGWIGDRFGAQRISIANAVLLVGGFVLIAADHEVLGALLVVMTRGMFNTLIPVLVIERGHGTVLSSQASYSTWRDFGAAVGPLTAPWLFLTVPQAPLYAALALALGLSGYFCLVRR